MSTINAINLPQRHGKVHQIQKFRKITRDGKEVVQIATEGYVYDDGEIEINWKDITSE